VSEFINHAIGTRYHSYPETPRGAAAGMLARNAAFGPENVTPILTSPTSVPWQSLDVGVAGVTVPITPRVTGVVRIIGVIGVKSSSGIQELLTVHVAVNGELLFIPFNPEPTLSASGYILIPILTEVNVFTNGSVLPLGVTATVQVILTANNPDVLSIDPGASSLDVHELMPATG